MNTEEFAVAIEQLREKHTLGYLDAIILWADQNGCELETAALMVKKDSVLKSKLMLEMQALHLVSIKVANALFEDKR